MRVVLATVAATVATLLLFSSSAAAASPTVTINQASGQADPTSTSPIEFTVIFSAGVTGFTGTDVDLSASTAGGTLIAEVTGSSATYTVKITGMTSAGQVKAQIPAGAAQSASSQSSLASTSTDNTVSWVPDSPSVTINQAAGQPDPTSAPTIEFSAVFSAPVTGFTASDIDLSKSTATGNLIVQVTGGPSIYTVAVAGMAGAGNVVASIPAGAALGPGNHPSFASTSVDNSVTWAPASAGGGGGGASDGGGSGGGGSSTGGGAQTTTVAPTASPSLRLLSSCRAKRPCATDRTGHVLPLKVACGTATPCSGQVKLVVNHKTIGKATLNLAAGATTRLRIPLSGRARHLLASRPKLPVALKVELGSNSTTTLIFARRGTAKRPA